MIHIITGSTLGGAEYVGDHLSDILLEQGFETTIHNQPNLSDIPASGVWLIVSSTHGAGELPDNIKPFVSQLLATPPNMSEVKCAVIGIGDSSYDTFCAAGKQLFSLLEDIGTQSITECFCIDILEHPVPEDAAEEWLKENIHRF